MLLLHEMSAQTKVGELQLARFALVQEEEVLRLDIPVTYLSIAQSDSLGNIIAVEVVDGLGDLSENVPCLVFA